MGELQQENRSCVCMKVTGHSGAGVGSAWRAAGEELEGQAGLEPSGVKPLREG